MIKDKGKRFLSELKLHSDYLKWKDELGRYERYDEAVESILSMHKEKYGDKITPYIDEIRPHLYNKNLLASQRNLQYRRDQIFSHNCRLYNCATTYANSPDVFSKGFYVLLCGTGLGVSLRKKFVSQLPDISRRSTETVLYTVEDSIEGWAEASKVLISSFCKHPSLYEEYFQLKVVFDFSKIRPKGAMISGGFKAPGSDGLRESLKKIESLLEANYGTFKSIVAYDVFMHLSDAVLSGGVRRSAMLVLVDHDDTDMVQAKSGSWYIDNPQRARSNNSVGLIRGKCTKEEFDSLIAVNQGDNDIGFIFCSSEDEIFNPCVEIGFSFYNEIIDKSKAAFQFCNLNEINASSLTNAYGRFDPDLFFAICRSSAVLGTLQAGYASFPYLGEETERIVKGEALLGISITGWMTCLDLFDPELLKAGSDIIKQTNKEVVKLIGINQAARTCCVKPSGNASVILGTSSGIHPEHSERYFRVMQINKESDVTKYLEENMREILEESRWSATNSDYVIYVPCENEKGTVYKDSIQGVKHLELIKLVQENWVMNGKNEELCYDKKACHNVSNTIIIDNMAEISEYLYQNQEYFGGVSFITNFGDKDYVQAPFTSVKNTEEIMKEYGDGALFMSGLIVDGLHYFNNNLWDAVDFVKNESRPIMSDSSEDVLLKKNWIKRVKKYSKNYFKGDLDKTIYCMKEVHLFHKWNTIKRKFKLVDFATILSKPKFKDVSDYASMACSGGQCEITSI